MPEEVLTGEEWQSVSVLVAGYCRSLNPEGRLGRYYRRIWDKIQPLCGWDMGASDE